MKGNRMNKLAETILRLGAQIDIAERAREGIRQKILELNSPLSVTWDRVVPNSIIESAEVGKTINAALSEATVEYRLHILEIADRILEKRVVHAMNELRGLVRATG